LQLVLFSLKKNSMDYCIAQVNIARLKFPLEHPNSKDFTDNLEQINILAEHSPGFIWRLKDEDGGASSNIVAYDDPLIIVNISVWESVDDLKNYVYKSEHVDFFVRRKEWFQKLNGEHIALWWIGEDQYPTVAMAKEKLVLLEKLGPTKDAFHFGRTYPDPGK